jgi:hypothetical protein
MADPLMNALNDHLREERGKRNAQEFAAWCSHWDGAPPRARRRLKRGVVADLELQPHRWLSAGLDLIKSAHVTSRVALFEGKEGEPMQSYLPYGVFQFGTELFLKGMFLCQYPACRRVAQNAYVPMEVRQRIFEKLRSLSHDLLRVIARLKRVRKYRDDKPTMLFLRRISAIIRLDYFPLHVTRSRWADSRYPKRFYDDLAKKGHADSHQQYPEQRVLLALFEPMERHVDQLWRLRRGLIEAR